MFSQQIMKYIVYNVMYVCAIFEAKPEEYRCAAAICVQSRVSHGLSCV
jgi:hypothetical protein